MGCSSSKDGSEYDPYAYERTKEVTQSQSLLVPTPPERIGDFFGSPVGEEVEKQRQSSIRTSDYSGSNHNRSNNYIEHAMTATSQTLIPSPRQQQASKQNVNNSSNSNVNQYYNNNSNSNNNINSQKQLNAPQPANVSPSTSPARMVNVTNIPPSARPSYVVPILPVSPSDDDFLSSSHSQQRNYHQPPPPQQYRAGAAAAAPPPSSPSAFLPPPSSMALASSIPAMSKANAISSDDEDFANIDEYDFSIAPSIAQRVVSITPDTILPHHSLQHQQLQQAASVATAASSIPQPQPSTAAPPAAAITGRRLDDHYERGQKLGFGAFAIVFVGIHRATQQLYAIKQIDRSKMFWGERDALEDEIQNLKLVRQGPHIVQLYQVFEERKSLCFLVMELLPGGELFDRILQKKSFTEREARDVCLCILRALEYMHERRVTHRDLKPENLLLRSFESDTDLKLADFGFAKRVKNPKDCKTLCGTPGYLAPEILERWPAYGVKCDLWSVGVILFLLLGSYLPFEDEDEDVVFDNTRNGKYEFIPNFWSHVSPGAKNLVTRLLTINPNKRISAAAALQHEWMLLNTVDDTQLNIMKLRDSVSKEQQQAKAQAQQGNRVDQLKDEFNTYLKKKREDSLLSVMSGTRASVVRVPLPRDDAAAGFSFAECYDRGEELGEGGFAIVFRATHKGTRETFAVKDITISKLEEGSESALDDEIDALKLLRGGPHIVRLFDVFKEPDHIYLVMEELKGGELLLRIVEKEVYTEREARKVCKILFEAVDFMHNKKIAHRDLKPENLLLVEQGDDTSIKIADFGFAKRVIRPNCLKTLCGTAEYVAPEILDLRMEGYDHRADMWSVGVIVYVLLGGYTPFEGPVEELAELIQRGSFEFHEEYWGHISTAAKDLIRAMLQVNPDKRISAEKALQSEWMIIEEEVLTSKDLSVTQDAIKKLLPGDKLRGMVKAIIATNKLCSLTKEFMGGLGQEDEISERFSRRTSQFTLATLSTLEHGANSSSNVPFNLLYEWGDQLGSGQFSVVHEATNRQTGDSYAAKRVPRKHLHPSDAVALQDEINALNAVKDCPHIVQLFDVFEEPDYTYLVLEKMEGGDLIDRIIDRRRYTEKDAKQVAVKLLQGVEFCHSRRIANRNLKPDNIRLVTSGDDTSVKLCDFGYAKRVLYPNALRTQCGTEGYVAPEILEHRPAYDVKCDMWSLGVLLYIVLGGYRPFLGQQPEEVMRKIRYGEYKFHDKYWNHVSNEAKNLISRMLTVDPNERISASDALKSPWVMADDEALDRNNLGDNLEELRTFKAKHKLRSAVKTIIATNKLQSLGYRAFKDF